MALDILLLSAFQLHRGRCVLGGPWDHRGEISGRCIRFFRVSETQRNEEGAETCVRDIRNRQKTETCSHEDYTRWKSIHFRQEWNRDKKKKGVFLSHS